MTEKKILPSPYYHKPPLRFKNFEIHYNKDRALGHIVKNSHDYYEFYFLISGEVTYYVEGHPCHLMPGDVILINPGQVHEAVIHTENSPDYERYVLWLNPAYLERLSSDITDLSVPFEKSYISNCRLSLPPDVKHVVSRLLEMILISSVSQEYGADLITNSYIIELLVLIARTKLFQRDYYFKEPFAERAGGSNVVPDVLNYINEHIYETLPVEQIASRFYISRSYLAKIFHEEIGLSLHQFIIKKKLFLARQDLQNGMSVNDICQKYHFGNYSSFFRAFKREFGQSPRAVKKEAPE